ncbi:MAG: DUF4925 domain-containing protein [Tannerellaceae bacterium]|jgi:hypothetical protein|nr:DUF4925 domain-containing protein [Tannerellaceae bacterium]
MKKDLFYSMMICLGLLLTSCGKDDGPDTPDVPDPPAPVLTWKDALGVYKADGDLSLTINDLPPAVGKEATLAAGTGENAKITLTNIIPDMATVEIDNVVVTKDGDDKATFEGEATVGNTTVALKGSLTGITGSAKTLNVNVARKVNSFVTGTWKLAEAATGGGKYVMVDVKTNNPANDVLLNQMVGPMIGGMLAQKVSDVTVVLSPDGLFDVNWTVTGASEATGMPDFVKSLVAIQYFEEDYKLYLAIDKSAVPLLAAIPVPEGIDIEALIGALAVDKGGFIAIPVNFASDAWMDSASASASPLAVTRADSPYPDIRFYVGKETLLPLLPVLMPLLSGGLPEGIPEYLLPLLQGLPEMVGGAEQFNVGLGFNKN